MGCLKGKVALVSGARQGIGRGIALCFAEEGADVLIGDLTCGEETAREVEAIEKLGCRARATQVDVSVREEVQGWISEGVSHMGRLDIAVANAALNMRQPFAEAHWADVQRTVAVTQFGVFHTCQLAAQQMLAQGGGGKIIVIGSIHAEHPFANNAAYDMSKGAIRQLVGVMANELARHHINVNMINPGWIDTPSEHVTRTEEELERVARRIPWGRLGTPREVGRCAVFLASPDAEYITGAEIRVDGGFKVVLTLPEPGSGGQK